MLRTALLAAVLVPLAGCPAPAQVDPGGELPSGSVFSGSGEPSDPPAEFEAARERWADAGLDAYAMTLQRICFCPSPDYTGPFEVVVRNGAVETVTLDGAAVDAERGETVAALFDLVAEAYEQGAESIAVEYDAEWGYPTSIGIDYSTQMADEEIAYRVSDLRPSDR
jgi:hypothetical protein